MSGLQVFLPEESVAQIVVALLISMAAFAYLSMTRPFVEPALDTLQLFGLAVQVMRLLRTTVDWTGQGWHQASLQ